MIGRRVYSTISGLLLVLCMPALATASIFRVSTTGSGNGGTWTTACSLDYALEQAEAGDSIWVKAGTYHRNAVAPFQLGTGVKMIGGFAGNETSASQSRPNLNLTILDGLVNGQNIGPVVTSQGNNQNTVLRGFQIIGGYSAVAPWDDPDFGAGGILLEDSSAVIVQCVLEGNKATYYGAGATVHGSGSPWFVNCEFLNNGTVGEPDPDKDTTPWAGGAVYVHSGSPTFMNCLFHHNRALQGGAIMVLNGLPTIVNSTFASNRAGDKYGGAISDLGGRAVIRNCIFWGNTAAHGGDQIFTSTRVQGDVSYSDIQGGWTGSTNINVDPLFVNAASNDYHLTSGSPCMDAGKSSAPTLPNDQGDLNWNTNTGEPTPLDLGLGPRVWTLIGTQKVDLGCYEYWVEPDTEPDSIIIVPPED